MGWADCGLYLWYYLGMEQESNFNNEMSLKLKILWFALVFLPANFVSIYWFFAWRFWDGPDLFVGFLFLVIPFVTPLLLLGWLFDSYKNNRRISFIIARLANITFSIVGFLLIVWWFLSEMRISPF
ncbi:hypothetical protein A2914_02005 [Candidatus Nomurabacteria bacterium RIFCSPLOWO2_01_FULL_41_21]|uniref:Uncharacterized protein n=1 Tax=Candidatus Nomurabacteria bacterium RIFCSPLOWO2_01_FULL_41_21 TaxID=1801776 RepID=A0A1F6X3G5_9BACT|nr:MAG: hypothetical protein A2914_02005 [Candidatus Nomurabacteria bacterium RIFCSPLOWO2_01_FULL_41_21]